jgi:Predicted metal-binding integral membrane protein (DUF2182)
LWLPSAAAAAADAGWTPGYWLIVFFMWTAMMVAMMLPSASPMVLLYARVVRQAETQGHGQSASAQLLPLPAAISPCGVCSAFWRSSHSGCSSAPERCRS